MLPDCRWASIVQLSQKPAQAVIPMCDHLIKEKRHTKVSHLLTCESGITYSQFIKSITNLPSWCSDILEEYPYAKI